MRFDFLNLRAFGHFTDYELLFEKTKNFHLIYGPNEAGKSTSLRSISHFLYGFPQQTNDAFLHSNSKLRIEGQLRKINGDSFRFTRRKGNKNTVLDANGKSLDEGILNDFLNGMTEDQFINMFALDHVRLREGGESLLQSGGNLGESLFSAASGINVVRRMIVELEKKSSDIYKKRASTTKLNKLLKEEKELIKEISQYQLKIHSWKELERSYLEGKKEIEELINRMKNLRIKQERLQRVKLTLPKIARLRDLRERFTKLGEVPDLPENSKELRNEALIKHKGALKNKQRAEEDRILILESLNHINIPECLIEQASLIDALYREVQSYQNNVSQLPILEGERKQLEVRVISFMKEIDSLNANINNIEMFRISAEKRATIRALCKQRPLIDQELEKCKNERNEMNEELQIKKEELSKRSKLPDIDELGIVIDQVKRAGQIEETLLSLFKDKEEQHKKINEEIRLLPLWNGTIHEFMELTVPCLSETVKKMERDHNELIQKLEKTREQIRFQEEAIENHQERIRELESLAEIPSEEKLLKVRAQRDQGWGFIRTKLQQGSWDQQLEAYTNGQPITTVYEQSVHEADHIADKLRIEAAKVGEKKKILADIESCRKKITKRMEEESNIIEQLSGWELAWIHLWKQTNINPLTPVEMLEWLGKYNEIKGLIQDFEKTHALILDLKSKKTQYKKALIFALSELVPITDEKSLDQLVGIAEKHQKKIMDDFYQHKILKESIFDIENRMKKAGIKHNDIEAKITRWKTDWKDAIQGTALSENTPISVAETLVDQYETGVQVYEEFSRIEKKQVTLQKQISIFKEKVKSILRTIDTSVDEHNEDIAVNQLYAALQQAQQDQVAIASKKEQLKKLQNVIKSADYEIEDAESTIKGLINQANCNNLEELEKVENIFLVKKGYKQEMEMKEDELFQIGNGRSLQELIEESESVEPDQIEVELNEIEYMLEDMEAKRSEMEQSHGVVKKEFEEKIQGNSTATVLAEQKKESILAQLANLTDEYIQLKLTSALLQKGIEHFRNQNQDPILNRASDLFERLTLHSFSGLMVDYDEKDHPVIMGIRTDGEKVSVDGMSDGTTDQLYLSLRIASIEKYAIENEPIPLIVDDILVHFDDARSKETLKILLELSKQTQIIFFTHHLRLVEIMKAIALESDYQLKELISNEPIIV